MPIHVMRSTRLAPIVLTMTLVGLHTVHAQDAPSLRTSFLARAMQPGEVVRLDVLCRCGEARPTARAFGDEVPLFPLAEGGRWRGLIGIDLDIRPGRIA